MHHLAVLAFASLSWAAVHEPRPPVEPGQEPPAPEKEKERIQLPPMPGSEGEDPLQKELVELFAKVETRMRAIDTQMYEAAAGRVPTKPVAGSGIEELLKSGQASQGPQSVGELLQSAVKDSQRTQSDIQRILEIAEQMASKSKSSQSQSQGQGQGQGQPKPGSQGSPLDRQDGTRPGEREQTPTQPGAQPQGSEQPGGQVPKDGKRPDDPDRPTKNSAGAPPPAGETAPGGSPNLVDRWGDLPVRAREIFRVEGTSDLPPQYRDWIDGYYRKLQSLEQR